MTSHSLKGCSYDPDGAESEAPKYEMNRKIQNPKIIEFKNKKYA